VGSSVESSSKGLGSAIAVRWRVALLVVALLGLSLGLVLGRLSGLQGKPVEARPGAGGQLEQAASAAPGARAPARDDAAASRVAAEAERALLRAELEQLRAEVDALRLALEEKEGGESAATAAPPRESPDGHPEAASDSSAKPWFDDASLVQAGFAASEVEQLREIWEQFELDKLYVFDQAVRRKAAGQPQQRGELKALQSEFRAEVGEEGYDAYLYATGQDNRVVIEQVLQSSPAMDAGLERGDVVLRYEDERIFRPGELQRASRSGAVGEVIRLEVLRDGSRISLTIPRGPLGVRMEKARIPPQRF